MAETVKQGSGPKDCQPGRVAMRPIPPPAPFIIKKDRFRLLFNQPMEQGCISIENGSGGLCMFLDENELFELCSATYAAYRRIKRNRRQQTPTAPQSQPTQAQEP